MKLKVINDLVLIKPYANEIQTDNKAVHDALKSGLLVLPDKYKGFYERVSFRGEVVSWGDSCKMPWQAHQKVIFSPFGTVKFNTNNETYRLIREYDILAVFDE